MVMIANVFFQLLLCLMLVIVNRFFLKQAFDILKEHCKLLPPTTGQYMAQANIPEEKMISFLSQIQDHFKQKNLENRKAKAGKRAKCGFWSFVSTVSAT